jgi:hypothetical protein
MGEQQHTPGPWEVVAPPQSSRRVMMPDDTVEIRAARESGRRGMIACLYAQNFADEDEANARLIAAAPDMLAALRPFAEWARQYELSTAGDIRDEVMLQSLRRARDAVAKATGAQP